MGLIPSSCRLLISVHKEVTFRGPVLTLGNQEIYGSHEDLKSFFRQMGCPYSETKCIPHSSAYFISRYPNRAKDFVHARTFFGMMGITDYWDMDFSDRDKPQILHDLNTPIPQRYIGKFSLIVDGGTMEHVFDVRQVMWNIVQMCKMSGWVVHLTPASNFMDHGFYSFSPCLFHDFYEANGFGDIICYIWQANPQNYFEPCPYFQYTYGMRFDKLIRPDRETLIFFAARKLVSYDVVTIPTQSMYKPEPSRAKKMVPVQRIPYDSSIVPSFMRPYWRGIRPLFVPILPLVYGVQKLLRAKCQRI